MQQANLLMQAAAFLSQQQGQVGNLNLGQMPTGSWLLANTTPALQDGSASDGVLPGSLPGSLPVFGAMPKHSARSPLPTQPQVEQQVSASAQLDVRGMQQSFAEALGGFIQPWFHAH